MSRSFSVVNVNGKSVSDGGRYMSSSPMGAAKKAGSRLLRKKGANNSVKVSVVETTRGSKNKEFSYNVKKVKVNDVVVRGGVEIVYNFKTVAKAL
jgi:hypothetical protein